MIKNWKNYINESKLSGIIPDGKTLCESNEYTFINISDTEKYEILYEGSEHGILLWFEEDNLINTGIYMFWKTKSKQLAVQSRYYILNDLNTMYVSEEITTKEFMDYVTDFTKTHDLYTELVELIYNEMIEQKDVKKYKREQSAKKFKI